MMRVSFALMLTVLTLILTLLPALLIWLVFSELMMSSQDLLQDATAASTHQLAATVQSMLLYESMQVLDMRLSEGENAMKSMVAFVYSSGLLQLNLRPAYVNFKDHILFKYMDRDFITLKGHEYFSSVSLKGGYFPNNIDVGPQLFWIIWQAMNIDYLAVLHNASLAEQFVHTLYVSTMELLPGERFMQANISCVDQQTGNITFEISTFNYPSFAITANKSVLGGWTSDLSFNTQNGQVELGLWAWLSAKNNTWVQAALTMSVQTISDQLLEQLGNSTEDRLYIFFRLPHGHMIAASHGKYYSQSNVDRRYINPYTNKLNMTLYYRYTCLDSNDALIYQSCVQLYDQYQSWPTIPALETEMVLGGIRHWTAVGLSNSSLPYTVVMLKNRETVMGPIDATQSRVDKDVDDKKGATYIILAVITFVGVVAPLSIGLWLGSRLMQLAAGMDKLAKLDFNVKSAPPTVFSELEHFQNSFRKMERGLHAFGKFVPQAVVRVLMAGKMQANDQMAGEKLTIMFADIEGFSTICETIPPERLATVCTEYFESMCNNIVHHKGTIDKFIGDCIMALWNAPEQLPGHERYAVEAALAMQEAVIDLHPQWRSRCLPILKFRLGIHTGSCLVGNFGCSHRVSYTCLGDSVNLSARLEALNKKFGTNLCVSQATYEGCRDHFHFRRLAKVTVPGKSEVLHVYEVLCRRELQEARQVRESAYFVVNAPPDIPGAVGAYDEEAPISPGSAPCLTPSSHLSPASPSPLSAGGNAMGLHSEDSASNPNAVPWHWFYVDKARLLDHAAAYHAASNALVVGDITKAADLLRGPSLMDLPDKAWAALLNQVEQVRATGMLWDGVFYFSEK